MMGVLGELERELDQRVLLRLQRIRNQLAIALNSLQEVAIQFNELADDLKGVVSDMEMLRGEISKLKTEKGGEKEKKGVGEG